MHLRPAQSGFSLVELSIVLVILGLLTGGILGGQALIRAAELRTLSTDAERYRAAVNTFRDKYLGIPGDLTNATAFWNKDNALCPGDTGTAGSPGTCNGNGDGAAVVTSFTPGTTSEFFQFWRQLALAGLIEGNYSGLNEVNYALCIPGTNCPRLRMSNASAAVLSYRTQTGTGNGWWSEQTMGQGMWLGIGNPGTGLSYPFNGIITPEEAWNLDTKMDDGRPATGGVTNVGCALYSSDCMVDQAMALPTYDCNTFALTAQYNLRGRDKSCSPMIKIGN